MTRLLPRFTVWLFSAWVFSTVCLGAQPIVVEKPESAGFSAERLGRLDKAMQGYVDRKEVAGAVAIVARRGKVVYHKSFGYRDAEAQAPMSNDVIFRIASMTKPIVSVALMMLWEEGHFQLMDPISKYLPEFAEMQVRVPSDDGDGEARELVPAKNPIRVQHLLTHTSGLASQFRGPGRAAFRKMQRTPEWTVGDYCVELAKIPLNFEPGSQFRQQE